MPRPLSGLRPRLLLLVLLAVLPATLILVAAAYGERENRRQAVRDDLLAVTQLVAHSQQLRMEAVRDAMAGAALFPELLSDDFQQCSGRLAALRELYPIYAGLAVFDLAGDAFCNSSGDNAPINVADRAYFQGALRTGDFTIGEFQIGRRLGVPTLGFGYPLRDAQGDIVRILFASVALDTLTVEVASTPLPAGSSISLVDRQGIILVRVPDPEAWVGARLPEAGVLAEMLQNETGIMERNGVDGVRRVYGYAPVVTPGSGSMYLNIGLPVETAYADSNRLLPALLLGIAAVTGMTLLAAGLWSRTVIVRPVERLAAATRRLAAGDLSARVGGPPELGELGHLGSAFDGMAAALQRRFDEVQAMHRLTAAVAEAVTLDEVYAQALNSLRDGLGSERAAVLLADAQGVMRFVAWRGLSDEYRAAAEGHSPWPADAPDPRPVLVADTLADPGLAALRPVLAREGIRAAGFIPLKGDGRLLGKLMVYDAAPHNYEAGEIEMAQTLARHIAFAIQRARYTAALHAETQALEALNRLANTLSAELNQDRLVQSVTDEATRLVGAAWGAFFYNVSDDQGERYVLYSLAGAAREAFEGFPMPRNTALFAPTFHGEPAIRLDDVHASERYGQSAPHFGLPVGHLPVTSYLAAPVTSRTGEVLGGLFFGHPARGVFTERHERIIVALAGQVAVAMDNARLYAEAQAATARLEERVVERTGALRQANLELAQEVEERKRAEALLEHSREQLRDLSAGLQAAREAERAHMAREIHDELGQQLTGLKMDVVRLPKRLEGPAAEVLRGHTEAMGELIDQAIQTVRRLATELRPGILDDFGLLAAIEWQTQEFQKRSGITCRLAAGVKLDHLRLDPDRATAMFRIFQETLTNVARHAGATQVDISLQEDDSCLVLSVQDNGRGILPQEVDGRRSLGLVGMRERVHLLSGVLEIRGAPGEGTRVLVRVPLHMGPAPTAPALPG